MAGFKPFGPITPNWIPCLRWYHTLQVKSNLLIFLAVCLNISTVINIKVLTNSNQQTQSYWFTSHIAAFLSVVLITEMLKICIQISYGSTDFKELSPCSVRYHLMESCAGVIYSRLFKYTQQSTAGFTENNIGPRTSWEVVHAVVVSCIVSHYSLHLT